MIDFSTVKDLRKQVNDEAYIKILETFLLALGDAHNVEGDGIHAVAQKAVVATTAIASVKAILNDEKSKRKDT
jgi:hypothetical protein